MPSGILTATDDAIERPTRSIEAGDPKPRRWHGVGNLANSDVRAGISGGGRRAAVAVADGLRRYRRLLRDRRTATLLGAGMASELGDWFNTIAVLLVAYDIGGGSVGVGFVLALRLAPRLIFQGPAGALVDRWPGARLLVGSQLLMAIIAAAFALLVVVPELWLLCLLIVLLEMVNTVAWPAFRVQLVRETPPDQFAAVNGLLSTGFTASQFIGPVLGGIALAALGPAPVFLVNGLTFAAVAAAFAWAYRSGRQSGAAPDFAAPASDTGEGRTGAVDASPAPVGPGGYAWLLRQTDLALFAAASLGLAIAVRGSISLFVDRANVLGLGDAGPGYFYAAVGLGAVVGGIGAGAGSHAGPGALRGAAVSMIVCAVGLGAFGALDTVPLALAALVAVGLATNVNEVLALTYFQHRLPPDRYGRFMALFILALGIGGMVGAVTAPLLEKVTTVAWSLATLALPGVVLALALLVRTMSSGRAGGDPGQ